MAKKTPLADVLAKELGYKDAKHLKDNLAARRGGDFAENVKGRLTEGQGFREAFGGSIKDKASDIKEAFSKKGMKKLAKNAYNTFFGGDDIFSAYMRGRIAKGKDTPLEPGKLSGDLSGDASSLQESNAVLSIIAKESLSLSGMARDMNVMRQNIVKLVKLENNLLPEQDQKQAVNKADAFFLKEDEREAKLEASKGKLMPKPAAPEAGEKPKEGGGILESILNFFSTGFLSSFKTLFNPMAILKVIGKVFVIGTILVSLFKGITAAFDKWKETGSIKEAIIAGLGAIVDFLSFGLFGEDSVRNLFDSVGSFLDPIISTVSGVITSIKDWIANNVGIPEIKLGSVTAPKWLGGATFDFGTIGPYYPFKKDPKSTKPEVSTPPAVGSSPAGTVAKTGAPTAGGVEVGSTPEGVNRLTGKPIEPASPSKESNNLFNREYLEYVAEGKHPRPLISPDRAKELLKSMDDAEKAPSAAPASPMPTVASSPQTGGSSGGTVSASSGGGGGAATTPTGSTTTPSAGESTSAPSGSELSKQSATVAEAQRMESAADQGTVVNAPTTNNTQGSQGKPAPSPIADVYNTDFVNSYFPTF